MKTNIELRDVEIPDESREQFEEYLELGKVSSWAFYFDQEKGIILRKVEPDEPKYKAFEIDWSWHPFPHLFDENLNTTGVRAEVGAKFGNYRIFRFGDRKDYKSNDAYETPSHSKGNYKYAYGRLEK